MTREASVVVTHEPSGQRVILGPGDFIGRSEVAALWLDDPRISEAHAMVSLRDGRLKLIALRGRFKHEGEVIKEAALCEGMTLTFAPGIEVVCERVEMPESVLGLRINDEIEVMLTNTMSLYAAEVPELRRCYDPDAAAVFWTTGSMWRSTLSEHALRVHDRFVLREALIVEVIAIPVERASRSRTREGLRRPLTFECHRIHVDIGSAGEPPVRISGVPGKILVAVLRRGGVVSCEEVIDEVWAGDHSTQLSLRQRFDTGLRRLRHQLRQVTSDASPLVVLDGTGVISLALAQADTIVHASDA